MRTTKKVVRELIAEVRKSKKFRSNREAWALVESIRETIADFLKPYGFGAVTLSPYRSSRWELSALAPSNPTDIPGSCKWIAYPVNITEFIADPTELLNEFLSDLATEGV